VVGGELMMPNVVLDAMIKRADFAQETEDKSIELFDKFDITKIQPKAPVINMLRKPDFQRETNHWSPDQIAEFIQSFAQWATYSVSHLVEVELSCVRD
jgi:hypothetical protein